MKIKLLERLIARIHTGFRNLRESSLYVPSTKRHYYVGDVAPSSLLNHKPGDGNLGAMISIDPETHRIKAIFIP
jgi:hypothetical protein